MRLIQKIKCYFGYHFWYNAVGWPMLQIEDRCLFCPDTFKRTDMDEAEKAFQNDLVKYGQVNNHYKLKKIIEKRKIELGIVDVSRRSKKTNRKIKRNQKLL